MSRSVSYQSGAELVKFTHIEPVYGEYNPETGEYEGEEYNELATQDEAENLIENITWALSTGFPSFEKVPRQDRAWARADRECWPVLQNGNCVVYLSEYCGLISISFVPADEGGDYCYGDRLGIQRDWIQTVEKKIDAAIESVAERLICCGHFSNGEGVYAPATARRAQLAAAVNGGTL